MDFIDLKQDEYGRLALMILCVLISVFLGWLVKKIAFYFYSKFDNGHKKDPGKYVLLIFISRIVILVIGVSYAVSLDPNIESATTSFVASAGIATAIVGFASKEVLANMVSGVMIIIFRPFTISHYINVGSITEGTVEEIKMLYTVIKDNTSRRLIIPNSKIMSSNIINSSYGDENVIQIVEFSVSYESDIEKAKNIIQEVFESSQLSLDKRTKLQKENKAPKVEVRLVSFGTYSINLAAHVWVANSTNSRKIKWVLNEEIRRRFNDEGIVFPYPNLIVREEKK